METCGVGGGWENVRRIRKAIHSTCCECHVSGVALISPVGPSPEDLKTGPGSAFPGTLLAPQRVHDISPSTRLLSLLPRHCRAAPFLLLSSHQLDVQLAAGGLPKKQCHIRAHPKTLANPVSLRAKAKLLPEGPWPGPLTSTGLYLLFRISRILSPVPGAVCSLEAPHLLRATSSPTATLSCLAFPAIPGCIPCRLLPCWSL